MSEEINYKVIRQFGPSVFKVKIPQSIIVKLNTYIDQIILNKEKQNNLNWGHKLVGDVTEEFFLEKEIIEKSGWLHFLSICVQRWIDIELKEKITKFNIQRSWVVRQFQNEYNPIHWHTGHISGAGFLKLPSSFGKHKQTNKLSDSYKGGKLQLVHGSKMFLCESLLTITPEVGDFYLFPSYLMHTVYPFKNTNEERRSISFNATIDDEIFNVYGY